MSKLLPQTIFALAMLALGLTALIFTDRIAARVLKKDAGKRERFNTIWSIRSGGICGLLMGLFILWFTLRSL